MNLLSAQFDEGMEAVLDANARLKEVNKDLKDSAAVLENTVNTLSNIAKLVGTLGRLLNPSPRISVPDLHGLASREGRNCHACTHYWQERGASGAVPEQEDWERAESFVRNRIQACQTA